MEKKFIPKKGEGYWYVFVRNMCNFADVNVRYEPYDKDLNYYPESNNYFKTEAEAKEAANKIRAIFDQCPLE